MTFFGNDDPFRSMGTGSYSDRRYSDKHYSDSSYSDMPLSMTEFYA